ncbi:MoxR-like ATPase [Nitrosomonas marina]|uniref:MoxR-like ATPase n=1 Tax=Nitrosomonas marina TaxID=917 RepID=A0A1I0AH06_9PROT|nr:MoxR family ATPase [Nitrosomonas marina]SES93479.1 MoxR-like ATPase [Nitrosomonas marina]
MSSENILKEAFTQLCRELEQQIIGQRVLVQRLLLTLLCDGHLLLEGAPGLAKTRAIKSLARGLEADFHRIQFTPDLLPADLTGSDVYHPETGSFSFNEGPLFHNVILADEINRAPAKVQSALLEAMEERQVTVGATSYPLPPLFLVMATQNPIEQEGTYPLPEAQLDRFLLHVRVDYPDRHASRKILQVVRHEALCALEHKVPLELRKVTQKQVFTARREIMQLHLAEAVEEYIVEIIETTRNPGQYGQELSSWIRWGASPRGAIAIERAARSMAWLAERDFVTPEDVQNVAPDALRHRILLNYEAEADGITAQQCIDQILASVPAP